MAWHWWRSEAASKEDCENNTLLELLGARRVAAELPAVGYSDIFWFIGVPGPANSYAMLDFALFAGWNNECFRY